MTSWLKWLARYDHPLTGKYRGKWHTAASKLDFSWWPAWHPAATVAYAALVWCGVVLYIPHREYGD